MITTPFLYSSEGLDPPPVGHETIHHTCPHYKWRYFQPKGSKKTLIPVKYPITFLFEEHQYENKHFLVVTGNDKKMIAVSDFSGRKYQELLTEVEVFRGSTQLNPQTAMIFFTRNKTNYVAKIDMEKQTLLNTQKLPPIP
jgi:hypothetical protein